MRRIAIDTNVLLRMLTHDGTRQSDMARELAARAVFVVSKTVLLETEWVLRSVLALPAAQINHLLQDLLETREVEIELEEEVARALEAHRAGMDFADALHLFGTTSHSDVFATFDKTMIKVARSHFSDVRVASCDDILTEADASRKSR